ncbi:universal stress protein [Kribbella lupini]|uniref:Universal stress protein n=1 Tax=Kribbella lupini TaxID=291602 RepID=A0ABN2ANG0_9ACTN
MNNWITRGPIAVEIDGASPAVLDFAWQEAARARADLVIVAPYQNFLPTAGTGALQPSAAAERSLEAASAQLRERDAGQVEITTLAVNGPRLEVLADVAALARLLVVGAPHPRGPHGLVAAQRWLQLASRTGRPLVVVPRRRPLSAAVNSVAVGIDGTELSLEAVAFAFETAANRNAELLVIHSHHTPYRTRGDAASAELTVAETLAGWDEEYPNVKVSRLVTARPVVDVLVRESENHGLVVLGAHAGPVPANDPVARRSIAEMTCPVAIVPHHVTRTEIDRLNRSRLGAAAS